MRPVGISMSENGEAITFDSVCHRTAGRPGNPLNSEMHVGRRKLPYLNRRPHCWNPIAGKSPGTQQTVICRVYNDYYAISIESVKIFFENLLFRIW